MHGIIFDVDGVVADTEAANAEASIRMFEDRFGLRGVQRSDFEEGIGRGAAAYVLAAARHHHRELSPDEVEEATRIRQENFLELLRLRPLPAFPGVMELIRDALSRPEHFALAIATSSTREMSGAVLASVGMPLSRMVYVNGDKVTHKKPHPEIFLLAAQEMGLPPQECVVIEDAPSGIQAAKAAGMRCIAVTNSFPADKLTEADLVVDSIAQVSTGTILKMFG